MRNLAVLAVSIVVALILFLVLTFANRPPDAEDLRLSKPVVIILKATLAGQPMDFWSVVQQGILEASREFGIPVEITGPNHEREIDRQVNIMSRVIGEDPPLIILAASDYELLAESVARAHENGIPVITFDSGVNSEYPVSFVATNNIEAGEKVGQEMDRRLSQDDPKPIAIVSHIRETATAIEREQGVRIALQERTIAGTWFCDNDETRAYEITIELLNDPEIGGIVALNEVATLGVAAAVAERGAQDRVVVIGFDNAPSELAYLEKGVIKAIVVQRPYNMGYLAVRTAVDYLKGRPIDSRIDTGSVLITADNMFQREYQELLFPVNDQE